MQQTSSVRDARHVLNYSGAAAPVLWEARVEGCDSQVEHVWVNHFLLQVQGIGI